MIIIVAPFATGHQVWLKWANSGVKQISEVCICGGTCELFVLCRAELCVCGFYQNLSLAPEHIMQHTNAFQIPSRSGGWNLTVSTGTSVGSCQESSKSSSTLSPGHSPCPDRLSHELHIKNIVYLLVPLIRWWYFRCLHCSHAVCAHVVAVTDAFLCRWLVLLPLFMGKCAFNLHLCSCPWWLTLLRSATGRLRESATWVLADVFWFSCR